MQRFGKRWRRTTRVVRVAGWDVGGGGWDEVEVEKEGCRREASGEWEASEKA